MAANVVNLILQMFQTVMSWFFTLEIAEGVSLGWIFVVVVLMFILIKFFLTGGGNENG